jgi:8-oxo-dGTP diphosphatase
VVTRDDQVLLGKRRNSHGDGTWALPGGHLEFGESWEQCAQREVLEETGMEVGNCHFIGATNDVMATEGKHYVTLFMAARSVEGSPRLCEPDKCERWQWFPWDALPKPLFAPLENLISTYGSGVVLSTGLGQ